MHDNFGRSIDYLRVALTDRCNLKCWYCVGRDDFKHLSPDEVISYDQLLRILRLAITQLGITKIRLTGGEPLLYERLEELVTNLTAMPKLRELTLTTNGLLLDQKAHALRRAGLHRVNVSLEGTSDQAYQQTTGQPCLQRVLAGLDALLQSGFNKPKINVVLCRTFEPDELRQLLDIGHRFARELRFIELMGHDHLQCPTIDDVVRLYSNIATLTPLPGAGTATHRYALAGYDVTLGLIPSRTQPFCAHCRRIRLTSDGQLRTCLFSHQGLPLRPLLQNNSSDEHLLKVMRHAILHKPHHPTSSELRMCTIGG